ncbi:hypothetical protein [Prosthecomicrobium sp. N25]|uniref:hypothetical protein n=1 Tax=Prosthecomicrobium sp. N25 TaxID=3129254 RepID=UPI003078665B
MTDRAIASKPLDVLVGMSVGLEPTPQDAEAVAVLVRLGLAAREGSGRPPTITTKGRAWAEAFQ